MALTVEYKGYRIVATPYPRPNNRYSNDVSIERHTGPDVRVRKFDGPIFLKSREEAELMAIHFGKRIIDGDVGGCSVADL